MGKEHLTGLVIAGLTFVACAPANATPAIPLQPGIIPVSTATDTATSTPTLTESSSPTNTLTPTFSPTFTSTLTPTFTPTFTPTLIPAATLKPNQFCAERPFSNVQLPKYIKYGPVNKNDKKIAITIDDFWFHTTNPGLTNRILDIAKSKNAHFSLGPVGRVLPYYTDSWLRALSEGHEFFDHTYNHDDLRTLTNQQIETDTAKVEAVYAKVFGQNYCRLKMVRAPLQAGIRDPRILSVYNGEGYSMLDWSISLNGGTTYDNLVDQALQDPNHVLNIVLIHAIPRDIDHLAQFIDSFQAKGYRIVTVSELFAN